MVNNKSSDNDKKIDGHGFKTYLRYSLTKPLMEAILGMIVLGLSGALLGVYLDQQFHTRGFAISLLVLGNILGSSKLMAKKFRAIKTLDNSTKSKVIMAQAGFLIPYAGLAAFYLSLSQRDSRPMLLAGFSVWCMITFLQLMSAKKILPGMPQNLENVAPLILPTLSALLTLGLWWLLLQTLPPGATEGFLGVIEILCLGVLNLYLLSKTAKTKNLAN